MPLNEEITPTTNHESDGFDNPMDAINETGSAFEITTEKNLHHEFDDSHVSLCKCTNITANEVLGMVLALGLRHKLTWAAQVDFLKLINVIYGEEKVGASKYLYFKTIEQNIGKNDMEYHYYCPACERYLGKKVDGLMCSCGEDVNVKDPNTFFLSVDVESQMKVILEDPHVRESILTYRFSREKIIKDNYEDIYDGDVYQKLFVNNGPLSNPYNFSYTFSTDGAAMGKSTNKTIWPILMVLNELAPTERKNYAILAGIYVGNKDPEQSTVLQPFVEQGNKLSTDGIAWVHDGKEVVSRIIPICAVADSVARWQLLNFSSFHAYYGCTFCYQKSEHFKEGQRYVIPEEKALERTTASTLEDVKEAYERMKLPRAQQNSRGVKGPSALLNLSYFDLIDGFVVDYMHAVLAGVIRLHTDLILCPTRKKFWIGMGEHIGMDHLITTIDDRIGKIKPPTFITRRPRDLKDRSLWKCNEWRSWLLFYCLPTLKGLLKEDKLEHLAMLSKALHILLQKSISIDDLNTAEELLLTYVFFFQQYFHKENMVYNIHLLTHLTKGVRNFGPLWTHNSFVYESYNRVILEMQSSPFSVALQITRKFLISAAFPVLIYRLAKNAKVFDYCESVLERKVKRFSRCNDVVFLGSGLPYTFQPNEEVQCDPSNLYPSQLVLSFDKMIYKNARFTSELYASELKNNDSVVYLKNGKIFRIQKILKLKEAEIFGIEILARPDIIKTRETIHSNISKVRGFGQLGAFKPNEIRCHGVFMNFSPKDIFVSDVPYGCFED